MLCRTRTSICHLVAFLFATSATRYAVGHPTNHDAATPISRELGNSLKSISQTVLVEMTIEPSAVPSTLPRNTLENAIEDHLFNSITDDVVDLRVDVRLVDGALVRDNGSTSTTFRLYLRVGFSYHAASAANYNAEDWVKGAFAQARDRYSFVDEINNSQSDLNVEEIVSMKVQLQNAPLVEESGVGVAELIGFAGGVIAAALVATLAWCILNRRQRDPNQVKGSASTDSTKQLEIIVSGNDDVSTLEEPITGMVTNHLTDERTIGSSAVGYDFEKVVGIQRPQHRSRDVASTFSEGTSYVDVLGARSSIFADDGSFGYQFESVSGGDSPSRFSQHHSQQQEDQPVIDTIIIRVTAPPGKLGIVLDDREGRTPIIHAIKFDSPLHGQVSLGDEMLSMNGMSVEEMNAREISRLIVEGRNRPKQFEFRRRRLHEV